MIQLDDFTTFHINSTNFDFTQASTNPKEIRVNLHNGTIDPNTFTKLNNKTTVNLKLGERNDDCSTVGCYFKCKAIKFKFDEKTFKTFLEANPNNKIETNCYFECSCAMQWIYENWKNVEKGIVSRVSVWLPYFFRQHYCAPQGVNLATLDTLSSKLFGVDTDIFEDGNYFTEECTDSKFK